MKTNILKSTHSDNSLPLAIITGGTSGIGLEIARRLSCDYNLALIYKSNHERAQSKLVELRALSSGQVQIFSESIIDDVSAKNVYQKIKLEFNTSPTVLINCAGHTEMKLFLNSSHENFDNIFKAHFFGVVAITRLAVEDMYQNKFGRIINFSSIAQFGNRSGQSAYCAAKSAIEGFTQSIAVELYHRNITVNCIKPGLLIDKETTTPNINTVNYEEVVDMVSLIIKPTSTSMTGSILLIDSGAGRWIKN